MTNWTTFGRGAAVSAIALSMAGVAMAQVTTSSIRGQVTNDDGQAVAGAMVTVTDPTTGLTRTATTNQVGQYTIRSLPVSNDYVVSVTSTDLQGQYLEDVGLNLGDATQVDFVLSADAEAHQDTIVVTASAADLAPTATGPSASFGLETLQKAPAINRNITDVLRLDPRIYVDEIPRRHQRCSVWR